jgi:LuxR family transcriptional regulator, maltose regulon positive regulatory protein
VSLPGVTVQRRTLERGTLVTGLIATKLYLPRLRDSRVARKRLLERLRQGSAARLILVSAPPGFGKSTLLAEWARDPSDGRLVAWLSLDASDGDPATFWSYVVAALGGVIPDVAATAGETASAPPEAVITVLINGLAAHPDEVWLVLDDFHLVEGRGVHEGLALLIDRLPPNAHVLLSTRSDPDLPLSRWRGRGELAELRAADLRFTADEAAAYLKSAGLDLAPMDAATLGGRTEGWIAALQLAALSLAGRDDARGFIDRFAGDDHYIVDYLMDEVLAHQPADVRTFLLRTAILDRLTGGLCDAVTGRAGGSATLTQLERANLFLIPLDDQLTWFRYHHLFADVLRARLQAELPDEVASLHRRASQWFEDAGELDDAIPHAVAAGDVDCATRLIETALPAARQQRRDATITRWLYALPLDAVRSSPVLSVFYGWTLLASGDVDAVASLLDHAEDVLAAHVPGTPPPGVDTDELRTLPATIAIYRASLAQARGDADGTAEQARRAQALAGPGDHFVRGAASGFLALAAWSAGDIRQAISTFADAVASLRAAGSRVDELSSTALLAEMWTVAGRPDIARTLVTAALAQAQELGPVASRGVADLRVQLSVLDLEAGDLDAAERHLEAAVSLADPASTSESRYRWFLAAGRLASARGDADRAIELLSGAEERYTPGFYPLIQPLAAVKARVWIAHGDLDRASAWAANRGASLSDKVTYLDEFDHLTLVRLLLARPGGPGTVAAVVDLLRRLDEAATASGREGSVREIRTLFAQAEQAHAPTRTPPGTMTGRELQVLRLLDGDLSGPQIARTLFVSDHTLSTHTKHIFAKLGVTSRREAVRRARERGLL